eukprot:TRINITY_DN2928_c0_g1_i1.p1 TRINITY_DN2928_c0_g1~~TRINITY_DN2928_c0_g1_i1.p1  ORF type:complete len:262 (+),score=82.06 TRINITY_DN2928_c0_g1_i1:233-1018(+)
MNKQINFTGTRDCDEFIPFPDIPAFLKSRGKCKNCSGGLINEHKAEVVQDKDIEKYLHHMATKFPGNHIITPENMGKLYLGGSSACKYDFLKQNDILNVINTAGAYGKFQPVFKKRVDKLIKGYEDLDPINVYNIEWDDSSEQELEGFGDAIKQAIDYLSSKSNTLIHCAQGVSRSSTLVIAVLYILNPPEILSKYNLNEDDQLSIDQILKFVKDKRAVVFPNNGFMKQLNLFTINLELVTELKDYLTESINNNDNNNNEN